MTAPAVPLYNYQKRWFLDRSRFKLGKFARQTGKTFTSTLELVDDCYDHEAHGGRTRWVILSRGERQAREAMLEGVHRHCQAYQFAIKALEYDHVGDEGSYRALEVAFSGGSRIIALPANPDTARGYSANIFLDEFAFHRDARKIWGAAYPIITRGGYKVRVTSTPNGKGNKFYELDTAFDKTGGDAAWSRHSVDVYQAAADGYPLNVAELKAGLNDADLWAQEYELQYIDEASAWLSYELINGCEDPAAGDPEGYQHGFCYVGNDIGRRRDLWVAWVWEQLGDVLWCRDIRTLKRATFAEQDDVLAEIMGTYRVLRVAMDQTGMGEKPVEDAKRRYGEYRVEGVLFTPANKLLLATIGKQGFEDRKLRIPQGSQELRADLHKLRKIVTPAGNVRFDAESDEAGHADRAWACFLGAYAAGNPAAPIDFQAAGPRAVLGAYDLTRGQPEGPREREVGFGTIAGGSDFRGWI